MTGTKPHPPLRGRCTSIRGRNLTFQAFGGSETVEVENPEAISVGDIVAIERSTGSGEARVTLLTPNRTQDRTTRFMSEVLDPARVKALKIRTLAEAGIREFFLARGFLETRTPLLVPCPGMETHIRPFQLADKRGEPQRFLPTSPEFAMKRLLVGGLEKIFQLSTSFRDEPRSPEHRAEFTMLEWYRAYAGYEDIMNDTEELLAFLARKILGKPSLTFTKSGGPQEISVAPPWPRLRVRDLFLEHAGVDLVASSDLASLKGHCQRLGLGGTQNASPEISPETWDDLYFKIWLNCIEPKLPADRAVFVYRYPKSQAALAQVNTDPDGSSWAKRFEIYAGGLELGNAFEELTDPKEQRERFVKDMALREHLYGPDFPANPIDEDFIQALTEGMPPSGGIAVGVDRLVMLLADQSDIGLTRWLE